MMNDSYYFLLLMGEGRLQWLLVTSYWRGGSHLRHLDKRQGVVKI